MQSEWVSLARDIFEWVKSGILLLCFSLFSLFGFAAIRLNSSPKILLI